MMIDKAHESKNVVIYARTTSELIRIMFINGHALAPSPTGYGRHDLILNITPMVRFGEENMIEFSFSSTSEGSNIQAAEIRYYAKGFYP
ncbi:MAG: hypothetical protein M3Y56_03780 [Armatimonadota bacterium]|nr:hypothetical protein [Armatimonadota bacterium]